jgi:hypothetical protein
MSDSTFTYVAGGSMPSTTLGSGNTVVIADASTGLNSIVSFGSIPAINLSGYFFDHYGTQTVGVSATGGIFGQTPSFVYTANSGPSFAVVSSSSVPEIKTTSYSELHQALTELHGLSDNDDWKIETPVYCASLQVAASLIEHNVPTPGVFTHGSKSVVFNWSGADVDLYLTVSKTRLSVLVSSPHGIELRTEISGASGDDTSRFFSALSSSRLLGPPEVSVASNANNK